MSILSKLGIAVLLVPWLAMSMYLFVPNVKASPTTWLIETVDAALDVGSYSSIAIHPEDGFPRIAYYDSHWDNLKYARWTGSAWSIETVDTVGDVGRYTSLAFDSSGNPHISYGDDANHDLKYARRTGSAWSVETVDSTGWLGWYTSLALDSSGNPHISYGDDANYDLKYARWTGSAWSIETVDSTGWLGWYNSLALDSSGKPHISYGDGGNDDLKYARWTGSAWSVETVDSTGDVGRYTSLALDSSGNPHISYEDVSNYDLKYARWTGSAWSIETVDSTGDVGFCTSLALDSEGNPHISYRDYTNDNLKYAAASNEYFATVNVTPLDSDSDGQNDAVEVKMDVDTSYSGTIRVHVNAFLVDASSHYADLKSSSWSITGQVVDWMHPNASVTLSVPAGYSAGPSNYMVMLTLFDDDGLLEDSYQKTSIYLYPSSTPPPTPMIESCNIMGERKDSFDMGEIVFVNGSGFSPSTGYSVYVVVDQATWTDGMTIPERVLGTEPWISSNADGDIDPTDMWHNPQTVGNYDIIVDVNGNGQYDSGIDVLDDNDTEITAGLSVIPEFSTILPFFILATSLSVILLKKKMLR